MEEIFLVSNIIGNKLLEAMAEEKALQKALTCHWEEAWELHIKADQSFL